MRPIRKFLLKGKENMIDHVKSVNELGCIYWVRASNKHMEVGDVCYLCLIGKGHNQVRYRLEVVETHCERKDQICFKKPYTKSGKLNYKLIPTAPIYVGDELSRDDLEKIGVNRHVQYIELNEEQSMYLDTFFGN